MIVNEEQKWLWNNFREYEQAFPYLHKFKKGYIYTLLVTHISEVDLLLFMQEVEIFSPNSYRFSTSYGATPL